ncbi:MAG: hypothetical protein O2815_08785 [Actinomycetota bacterium]|nr:hypothetical protein [Actinomycetota bacterium]
MSSANERWSDADIVEACDWSSALGRRGSRGLSYDIKIVFR